MKRVLVTLFSLLIYNTASAITLSGGTSGSIFNGYGASEVWTGTNTVYKLHITTYVTWGTADGNYWSDYESGPSVLSVGKYNIKLGAVDQRSGYNGGWDNLVSGDSIFIGNYTGRSNAGYGNIFIGQAAGGDSFGASTGTTCIFIGNSAGFSNGGTNHIYIGKNAGRGITTQATQNNIVLGDIYGVSTDTYRIRIGATDKEIIQADMVGGHVQLRGNVGVGSTFPSDIKAAYALQSYGWIASSSGYVFPDGTVLVSTAGIGGATSSGVSISTFTLDIGSAGDLSYSTSPFVAIPGARALVSHTTWYITGLQGYCIYTSTVGSAFFNLAVCTSTGNITEHTYAITSTSVEVSTEAKTSAWQSVNYTASPNTIFALHCIGAPTTGTLISEYGIKVRYWRRLD